MFYTKKSLPQTQMKPPLDQDKTDLRKQINTDSVHALTLDILIQAMEACFTNKHNPKKSLTLG